MTAEELEALVEWIESRSEEENAALLDQIDAGVFGQRFITEAVG